MKNIFMKRVFNKPIVLLFLLLPFLTTTSCKDRGISDSSADYLLPSARKAISDTNSILFAEFSGYPADKSQLPIGVFDSGTGGLTVLEALLKIDEFNNSTRKEGKDGIPDFSGEDFVYLADQANMPYGNYASENKTDFLKELIIKDALFLTKAPNRSKIVVIACNTATAFGLSDIRNMLDASGTGVLAVGVINVASQAALDFYKNDNNAAIGVMATVGTISSGGYERTLRKLAENNKSLRNLEVVNQGGLGFAEAIDGEYDYIDRNADSIRSNYRGPRLSADSTGIKPELMQVYNFDTSNNALLVEYSNNILSSVQLNSPGNYARFHLVSLLEKYRKSGSKTKLKTIILGCTHYPYLTDTLYACLKELRKIKVGDTYPYAEITDVNLKFLDPSPFVAKEVHKLISSQKLFKKYNRTTSVKPFITVPGKDIPQKYLDLNGNLTYEYKYGREIGSEIDYITTVPFSPDNIFEANRLRIQARLPRTYGHIKQFVEKNEF